MVQRPEWVETGNISLLSLLPVDPPEVNTLILKGVVENLKICLSKGRIGNVKADDFTLLGITAKTSTHIGILILKESDTLGRVNVQGNVVAVIVKPCKKLSVIGEKLGIPAISRPTGKGGIVKGLNSVFGLTCNGILAESLDNVSPMPIHINGCNGDGKLFINELLHKSAVLLLGVGIVARPPVAESIFRNKRHLSCKLKEVTELTEIVMSVGEIVTI